MDFLNFFATPLGYVSEIDLARLEDLGWIGVRWKLIFEIRFGFGSDMDLKALLSRVAKCHGYDGYVCAKNWQLVVKSLEKQKNLVKSSHFWEDL